MYKTIALTWTEYRAWLPSYGMPCAALWASMGDDSDLNDALAYMAKNNRQPACAPADMRVHTFGRIELNWRAMALEAHRNKSCV